MSDNIEIRFKCAKEPKDWVAIDSYGDCVSLRGQYDGSELDFIFDIPTAIKLAKTIRTEINIVKGINHG